MAVAWASFYFLLCGHIRWYEDLGKRVEKVTGELNSLLLATLSMGATAVALFVFTPEAVQRILYTKEPWENWHRGATAWSLIFCFYQVLKFAHGQIKVWRLGSLFFGVTIIWIIVFMFPSQHTVSEYLSITGTAGLLSLVFNSMLVYAHRNHDQAGQEHSRLESWRSWQSIWFSDTPVIVACGLIYLYGRTRSNLQIPFVAGVLAFQLLTSKAVFMLIEGDAIPVPLAPPPKALQKHE